MEGLEVKIQESIKQFSEKFSQCDNIKEFENTNREFEILVKKGIVEKRGNNLFSISDLHLKEQTVFNVK